MIDYTLLYSIPGVLLILTPACLAMFMTKTNLSQRVLMALSVFLGVLYVTEATFFGLLPNHPTAIHVLHHFAFMMLIVSYACFIQTLTLPGGWQWKKNAWWVIVLVVLFIINSWIKLSMNTAESTMFYNHYINHTHNHIGLRPIPVFYIHYGYYINKYSLLAIWMFEIIWSFFMLIRYNKAVREVIASDKLKNSGLTVWYPTIAGLLLLIQLTDIYAIRRPDLPILQIFYFLLKCIVTVHIAYAIYATRYSMEDIKALYEKHDLDIMQDQAVGLLVSPSSEASEETPTAGETASTTAPQASATTGAANPTPQVGRTPKPAAGTPGLVLTREQMAEYEEKFAQLIEEKFFLEEDVTMPTFARKLGTNPTYARTFIHDEGYESFSDMVHELRKNYAKELMAQHPEYTMKEVAALCGYTNYTSFYRHFN